MFFWLFWNPSIFISKGKKIFLISSQINNFKPFFQLFKRKLHSGYPKNFTENQKTWKFSKKIANAVLDFRRCLIKFYVYYLNYLNLRQFLHVLMINSLACISLVA